MRGNIMATDLPLAPLERLVRRAKADRVSMTAAEVLRDVLNEIGLEISSRAVELATHAGRKTVTGEDIRLAYTQWKKRW